jgi:hypothetical protein
MDIDAYTPDAICRALGLEGFAPAPVAAGWAARLLLLPSFHPEVCVTATMTAPAEGTLEVRVPAEQVWVAGAIPQLTHRDGAPLPPAAAALAAPPEARTAGGMLDGMTFALALRTPESVGERHGTAATDPAVDAWLRTVLDAARAAVRDEACLRALDAARGYLRDGDWQPPDAPGPAVTRLAVLAEEVEREAVVRAIDDVRGAGGRG